MSFCGCKTKKKSGTKYKCKVCGYIYDPAVGDPAGNIMSGVDFDMLPVVWHCPKCKATRDKFEKI